MVVVEVHAADVVSADVISTSKLELLLPVVWLTSEVDRSKPVAATKSTI